MDGMIGLDVDPIGWIALASSSVFVDAENGRQANGHQIGQNARVRTGGTFAVGAKRIKSNVNPVVAGGERNRLPTRDDILSDEFADGLGTVVVGIEHADVIVDESPHKRVLPEILFL